MDHFDDGNQDQIVTTLMLEPRTREALPVPRDPNQKISVWKILKDSIGKDLTKIAMPVTFNEPITMLQKNAEIMEYQALLVKANSCTDAALRQVYVAVFNMTQYACT